VPVPFETGIQQVTTFGSASTLIWQPSNTSTSAYGPLGSIAVGSTLKDLVITNTGANTCYVGMGTVIAGTPTGVAVPAGATLYLYGYNVIAANNANGDVWANTGAVSTTTSVVVGLATSPAGV